MTWQPVTAARVPATAAREERDGRVAVVVAAGGAGTRLGAQVPKALCPLGGVPLVVHAVRAVHAAGCVDRVVVAAPSGAEDAMAQALSASGDLPDPGDHPAPGGLPGPGAAAVTVTAGGGDRQASVAAALATLGAETGVVLVHDAARALAPPHLVADVVAAVRGGADAVIPAVPVVDTVVDVGGDEYASYSVDRARLRAVQTPQGFRRSVLAAAHETYAGGAGAEGAPATDDAGLVARCGVPVRTVPGSPEALKITTPWDLTVAEALVAARRTSA